MVKDKEIPEDPRSFMPVLYYFPSYNIKEDSLLITYFLGFDNKEEQKKVFEIYERMIEGLEFF